jgi:muramoyltetrapeptide carboxypeptidase
MIRPPFLQPGDKIGIVAPGRKIGAPDIEAAIKKIASWNLEVVPAPHLFSNDHSYLAGTDEQRRDDYQRMLDDPSIRAIINARGGYGSTRLIDHLDFTAFQKNPKWVVGFSDITAVHLKLFQLGFESIHATMPILFSKPESMDSVMSLKTMLFGEYHAIHATSAIMNKTGKCNGELVGGNLSLVVDSLGTSSEINTDGKILVLEEIDEYLYRIDRMMVHLKRSGKLSKLSGLVIGHMTDLLDTELRFGETIEGIIQYHTREYNYPIAFHFPVGHENPNLAWPHGGKATLEVSENGSMLFFIKDQNHKYSASA